MSNRPPIVSLVKAPALTNAYALSTLMTPPLGLAYLAGTLGANAIRCEIVDAVGEKPDQILPLTFCDSFSIGLSADEIVEKISYDADIIGLSCMFSNGWPFDARLAQSIRQRFPEALIVVGGEHATACYEYILKTCSAVDVCVLGEGEDILLELVRMVRANASFSEVAGIAFRQNGVVHANPRRNRISNIDDIPLPDWDLVPLENYLTRGISHGSSMVRSMPLMATRGCPFQCTFCSSPRMWTTQWTPRKPSLVIDEMEKWIEIYDVTNFDLYDLTAIIRKDWLVEFSNELLERNLPITYQLPSGTRTEALDEEAVDLLYRSGCRNLNYAPESGSERTLKAVKKKVKLPRMLRSLRAATKRGLSVMVNIIFFPDDTFRDVLADFKLMLKCAWYGVDDITFVPYVPYPGAELYDELVTAGRLPPLSEEFLISLLTHSDITKAESHNPRFSARQVQYIRLLFLGMFYSLQFLVRPQRVAHTVRNLVRRAPRSKGEKTLLMLVERLSRIRSLNSFRAS